MNKYFEKIIENEILFSNLAAKQFSNTENISRENLKNDLGARSSEIRRVISETNKIIDNHITPYIKNPSLLNNELVVEFEELAEKLSGYKENLDTGLSFEMRTAITEYAKSIGDENMFIKNMFFKGLTLFYLDTSLFKPEMSECYEIIISYGDRYEEFDKATRNIIVRAFGNYYISLPNNEIDERFRRFDLAIDFWTNTAQKVDPDFPWNAYFNNVHDNLCSSVISALRIEKMLHM